jgi:site-specific DNA-methyltransferase (adenine-specific)
MIVLKNANCLDELRKMEDDVVDAVVTDPPYGIAYKNRKGQGVKNDDRPYIWWLHDAYRITKDKGALVCFCRWDVQEAFRWAIELAGYRVRSQVIWDRGVAGMGDTKATFAPRHDVVWFATKGKFQFPNGRPKSVLPVQRLMKNLIHPTQKPVALMEDLVLAVTPEGGVVLDRFMRTGTTGLACVKNGYASIGVEEEREHFITARKPIPEGAKSAA